MPRKKKTTEEIKSNRPKNDSAYIENAGVVMEHEIVETLVSNYMPYAMSVIVSRAIPEIDGFKPSHRKILYTMYKMGLINSGRVKSSNAVGEVMKLHPHGDQTIYDTMVRLSRGNETLLHPYVDGKGNFGKSYLRDTAYAASRYTEVKLMPICEELFRDIDKDAIDMVDNYDGTRKEPSLLPTSFPSILVNFNVGIAVGMASNICPFNLKEICEATIALIKNPETDIGDIVKAPDFPVGGLILYDATSMHQIIDTGRGSIKVRSKYRYDEKEHCIEVTEIPPTTTVEAIVEKVIELAKTGKIKEVSDIRDETDLGGLKIAIDIKKGTDPDKLMTKLFKLTPLEDAFACNFNVLIGASPRVMGVKEIITEWTAFRTECVKRRTYFELSKKKEKLHLLEGLEKILLDIDKAVKIVKETKEEKEVVPNLMIGFGIDEKQGEYVAEIKLRHFNREHILSRTKEIKDLKAEIKEMEAILASKDRLNNVIIDELNNVVSKYGKDRRSRIIYEYDSYTAQDEKEEIPDYPVNLFFTKEGYFKKITPQSWKISSEHNLKEGDKVIESIESTNTSDLLFFTDKGQVYKSKASEFSDTKASVLGEYIPVKLGMDSGENAIYMVVTKNYKGNMLFAFENGKVAKVPLSSYETKTNRKKLIGAYNTKSLLVGVIYQPIEDRILLKTSDGKIAIVSSVKINPKASRETNGVQIVTLKKTSKLISMKKYEADSIKNEHKYIPRTLPTAAYKENVEDIYEQVLLK